MTSVAFDSPLLVTVIVKLTRSPTSTLLISATLTMLRLTLGSAVTFVLLEVTTVAFSLQLTVATFANVPLVNNLTCTQTLALVPLAIWEIVHVTF
jgi:hypothetical protein